MTSSAIGVDVGGTNIKIAVFDASTFEILKSETVPTEAVKGFAHVLNTVVSLVERFKTEEALPIGVCVPGPVLQPEGRLLRAPNIPGSENIALKDELEKRLGQVVAVDNDAHCFALTEAVLGAGKGHRVVSGITIGTGVGGGLVVDGKLFYGGHGFASEVGHMLLMPGKPPYETPDKRGDVEQFLSGTAFGERCKAAQSPDDYLQGAVCEFLYPEIFQEVAWLCTNVTHAYDPSIIVFGGSTGKALKPHLGSIAQELTKWLLPSVPVPKLATAERQHPGALGAALLAMS